MIFWLFMATFGPNVSQDWHNRPKFGLKKAKPKNQTIQNPSFNFVDIFGRFRLFGVILGLKCTEIRGKPKKSKIR